MFFLLSWSNQNESGWQQQNPEGNASDTPCQNESRMLQKSLHWASYQILRILNPNVQIIYLTVQG